MKPIPIDVRSTSGPPVANFTHQPNAIPNSSSNTMNTPLNLSHDWNFKTSPIPPKRLEMVSRGGFSKKYSSFWLDERSIFRHVTNREPFWKPFRERLKVIIGCIFLPIILIRTSLNESRCTIAPNWALMMEPKSRFELTKDYRKRSSYQNSKAENL